MEKFPFYILLHWLVVLVLSPLFLGIISRTKAVFAGRVGPPLFQPYFDLAKLFRKKCVYGYPTTWIFRAAPMVVLASFLVLSLMVPLGDLKAPVRFAGDIFLAAYLLGLARFFMITAAMDTGFSMEGMGASREAVFSCLSELAFFMNFITLALLTGTVSLSGMIGSEAPMSWTFQGSSLLLVVSSLFIVALAENCRIPVDDPETHLELTMIHEVMILEHSGVDLAYMLYGGAVKLFVLMGILIPIVAPYRAHGPVVSSLVFLIGMSCLAVLVGIVESTMARLRLNRVSNLLLIAFTLAFFGFVVALWKAWIWKG